MLNLGSRMKENYEQVFNYKLPKRMPVIIRLDGRAFHTFTKKYFNEQPFDKNFINFMDNIALYLCGNIQNCKLAYIQSDEISLLLHNYNKLNTESWFNNEIQKMCSISAAIASSYAMFYLSLGNKEIHNIVQFDSRVFVLPESEVCNYFIWRQKDWERNSIQMIARSFYSNKECYKKSCSDLQEMIFQKGKNWNDYETHLKRGRCVYKTNNYGWILDNNIPIFTQNRSYIEDLLKCEE